PVWIWAALHHGDNLLFQLAERHSARGFHPAYLLEFLLANLVLATPPLTVALVLAWEIAWRRSEPAGRALCAGAAAPIVLFGAVGLFERIGPHWSGPGLMVATAPLALLPFLWKRALVAWGIGTGIVINALLMSALMFPERWMRLDWSYPGYPKHIATSQLASL